MLAGSQTRCCRHSFWREAVVLRTNIAITKSKVLFLVVAFAAGCSTTPVRIADARVVPADRVFLQSLAPDGNARVIFVRDQGFSGGGVYNHLFVDGRRAASLDPGEKVEFVVAPGEHIFGVVPTNLLGNHTL